MKKLSYIFLFLVLALAAALHVKHRLSLGAEAYIYGYPLVLMDATQRSSESTVGVNQLGHRLELPDHNFRAVVRPNNDTAYSIAWLDLSGGPQVLSLPDMGARYYVMPFMDAWSNVFAQLGSSSTGQKSGDYLIYGPGWKGDLPADIPAVEAPTNKVWLIGRSQINGLDDMQKLQQKLSQMALTSLTEFNSGERHYSRVITELDKSNVLAEVDDMEPADFFQRLNRLMAEQTAPVADAAQLERLNFIHIGSGLDFKNNVGVDPWLIGNGAKLAKQALQDKKSEDRSGVNGWAIVRKGIGRYGIDYKTRAFVAMIGLGALPPEEASYPNTFKDSNGDRLDGNYRYRLHFAPGELPPAKAFWSITLYDRDGFMVDNKIQRYSIGDRDNLHFNPDGSLDIFVQSLSHELSDNWLPAPNGEFSITMRVYLPSKQYLDGQWWPPSVQRLP